MKLETEKLIINVPIVKLSNIGDNEVYVLLEKFNICGSIKVKTVYRILKQAIQEGKLKQGNTILEASSGNTAIALAYLGKCFGFPVKIVLPRSTAPCKIRLIESYGAEIVKVKGITDDCITVRDEIYKENPSKYFLPDQFSNYSNIDAHYNLTGPYIYDNINNLDFCVIGLGTSGTIIGTGKYLKEKNPNIKIIGINPIEKVEGLRNFKTTKMKIPFYEEYKDLIDEIIDVDFDNDSVEGIKYMLEEGYFVGISSGAIFSGLVKYLQGKSGLKGLFIAPDGGDFYIERIMKLLDNDNFCGCK
ncbi:MAG: pyridoxal-phosphate dependent enzyme [Candidatus Absconditabacteria bacterium]